MTSDAGRSGLRPPGDSAQQPARAVQPLWRSGRMWLGIVLSLGSLVLAMRGIDRGEIAATLRTTHLGWLLGAMLVVLISAVAKAVRWRLLFSQGSSRSISSPPSIGILRLTRIWLAGASLNLALPAPRSGDLARAYLAGEAGKVSKSLVMGTIAAEKLLDMVLLAVCFIVLVPLVVLPQELAARRFPIIGMTMLVMVLVFVMLWQRRRLLALAEWLLGQLPERWGRPLLGSVERAVQGLDALRSPSLLFWLAVSSVIIWFLSVYTNYLVFLALGMRPSWVQSLFLLVVLQAGVAVPSTPGKVGVFQVLCRWSLGLFGVSATLGTTYGILLYLAAPVLLMVLGAMALGKESWHLRRLSVILDSGIGQGRGVALGPGMCRNGTGQSL